MPPVSRHQSALRSAAAAIGLLAAIVAIAQPRSAAAAVDPIAAPAPARPGGISGEVTSDLTGRGVAGAQIELEGTKLRATSEASGRFHLSPVPDGTYRLLVSCEGYEPALVTGVVVTPARETPVAVGLHETVRREETVSVSASAFDKPLDVTSSSFAMSYEEVRRAPGALADVSRMVQALPGIGPRDDGRNDIVARGGSPAENLILVDGFEVPSLNHFGAQGTSGGAITSLNAETISGVNFLAGGFPAQHGNRLSSVLDISLREGNRDRVEAEFDLGMAGAGLLAEGPIGGKGSWLLSGRRSFVDLIADAYGLTAVPQYANYQAKAVYDLTPSSRVSLVSLGGWDTIDSTFDAEDLDDPNTITGSGTGWRDMTGLSLRTFLGGRSIATIAASHALNRYEQDYFDQQRDGALIERNRSTEHETTLRTDLGIRTPGGSLTLGGTAKRFQARLDIDQPIGAENPFSTEEDARINVANVHEDVESWQFGGHLQLSQRLARFATLNLGTRVDRFAVNDVSEWSPRAGLTLHLSRQLDLTASVGRYHQSPALLLFESHPGNGGLLPIRAEHLTAGFEWRPARDVRFTAEAYEKRYRRYPVSTELPFLTTADAGEQFEISALMTPLVSEGEGRGHGLELFVEKKIGGRLWGQASYAWARTEQKAKDGLWRRGTYDLPHVLALVAGVRVTRRMDASAKFSYSSGRPTTPLLLAESLEQNRLVLDPGRYNEERAPAYHRLDLRLDRRSTHRWGNIVFYLELDNVYDRKNVRYYFWNPKTRERHEGTQLAFMAIGGVNLEF